MFGLRNRIRLANELRWGFFLVVYTLLEESFPKYVTELGKNMQYLRLDGCRKGGMLTETCVYYFFKFMKTRNSG